MHKITNCVNLINEINEVSNAVKEKGQYVLTSGAVRGKVSKLLVSAMAIHRHMKQHPKPPHKRVLTPQPTPPMMLESLRDFRTYLEERLTETHLSIPEAEEMVTWAADCNRMMSRVNVHVLGLGVNRTSGDELKSDGKMLVSRGRELMKRRRGKGRLPRVVYLGVKRRVEDLKDSLTYVDNKPRKLTIKSVGIDHNTVALLDPVHLGNEDPFRGIKEPCVRTFTSRLSRRRKKLCGNKTIA